MVLHLKYFVKKDGRLSSLRNLDFGWYTPKLKILNIVEGCRPPEKHCPLFRNRGSHPPQGEVFVTSKSVYIMPYYIINCCSWYVSVNPFVFKVQDINEQRILCISCFLAGEDGQESVVAVVVFFPACLYAFDSQLTASSQWDGNHAPSQGKLNYQESRIKSGAWAAALNNGHQWLQVDLGSQKTVRTLATQGRNYDPHWPHGSHAQWVTKYKLQYSNDGLHFQYYMEQGAVKVKANILFIVVR